MNTIMESISITPLLHHPKSTNGIAVNIASPNPTNPIAG
jgi:hypothetical protein